MAESVLGRLDPACIRLEPFPYLIAEEALSPAYYAALEADYPALETVAGPGPLANNKLYTRSARDILNDEAIPAIWREFFAYHTSQAFLEESLNFWSAAIAREYPDIEQRFGKPLSQLTAAIRHRGRDKMPDNLAADVILDCQFGVNSPVTAPSSVRVPHVDNPFKLFAGLLYFRRSDDASTGGDLNLYRVTTERYSFDRKLNVAEHDIEVADQVRYRPNTAIVWLNTARSLHGVTPRAVTDVPRRYVNFIGECYRTSPRGFFPVRRNLAERTLEAVRSLVGAR